MAQSMKKLDQILAILMIGGGVLIGIWGSFTLVRLWHDSGARWSAVPCVIRTFEVDTDPEKPWVFRVKAAYDYQVEGRAYHGTRVWPHGQATTDYEDISRCRAALTAKIPDSPSDLRNRTAECLVDPEDPASAVLMASLNQVTWGFGIAGSVVLWTTAFIVLSRRRCSGVRAGQKREPLPLAIFLTLAMAGVATSAFAGWGVNERWRMRGWVEVPATVVASYLQWSDMGSGRRSGGSSSRQRVLYRYQFEGREHLSNRTKVLEIYRRNRRGEPDRELVRRYPAGTSMSVFVDPREPWRAVMDREFGWSGVFLLFPLPFVALGGWGIARGCWPSQRRARR
jgi:Protein of unknown function (DUF3592)